MPILIYINTLMISKLLLDEPNSFLLQNPSIFKKIQSVFNRSFKVF